MAECGFSETLLGNEGGGHEINSEEFELAVLRQMVHEEMPS